jgi:hypothetical protein
VFDLVVHFPHPALPLRVVEVEHLGQGPVDVSSEKGRLLMNPIQGVANYSPNKVTSTSLCCPQCGQVKGTVRELRPLIRL